MWSHKAETPTLSKSSLAKAVWPKKARHMLANGSNKLRPCAPLLICCFPPHAHSAPRTHTPLLGGLAATTLRGGASPLSLGWSKLQAALLVSFLLSSVLLSSFPFSPSLEAVTVQVNCDEFVIHVVTSLLCIILDRACDSSTQGV